MKVDLGKILFLVLFLTLSAMTALAGTIKGTVTDKQTKEPLTGATVQVAGSTSGAVADIDGNYTLSVPDGTYDLVVRYVGYVDINARQVKVSGETVLNFEMETDAQTLGEVSVVAKKNLEGERALQVERQKATLAIENLGAKEMGIKGIGNVQEGVKKLTGISIAESGQLIVRGLGDRYSSTTLNGLPIASPNPDNKLIPLDLFPSSTVQNITVSKVYDASAFADYSGAHIDISTKENVTDEFLNVSFNVGGRFNTLGRDFYQMDRDGTLFKTPSLDEKIYDMPLLDFDEYVTKNNIFRTTFDVDKRTALPEFGGNLGFGRNFGIGDQTLSLLASLSLSNETQRMDDAFYKTLEATGNVQNDFTYDEYTATLKMAALASVGYTLRQHDRIGYTFFYARNASDSYQSREGIDAEGHNLWGSNDITHIYTLQNHQLNGHHEFGTRWQLNWAGSYGKTGSEEPDRRQVMFTKDDAGNLQLFKLNRQETMRYFGELNEEEWVGNLDLKYNWSEQNFVKMGLAYKNKDRDYMGTRFYYNVNKLNPTIDNIYDTDGFLNQENVENGNIVIERKMQPHDTYRAGMDIYAAYAQTDFYPLSSLLVNVGLRYEMTKQWVEYAIEGDQKYQRRRDLNKNDIFPTVNLKYSMNDRNNLRMSLSRTITRPSFIEMAPFLYQESYGAAMIRGNAELKNGYNYNIDLRYERFDQQNSNNMFSITGYAKILEDPIERTQTLSGGAAVHSFQNADTGVAAGVEVEFRRELFRDFRVGANASYMYTNVQLPEGGAYTNAQRSLQGASPYLVNADISYAPKFKNDTQLTATLLYNLQGPRIHAVGISGLGDVKQEDLHTLDFVATYKLNDHWNFKLQMTDLLNQDIVFRQEVKDGRKLEVERYGRGTTFELGFSYTL